MECLEFNAIIGGRAARVYGPVYLTTGCERTQPALISIKGSIKNIQKTLIGLLIMFRVIMTKVKK